MSVKSSTTPHHSVEIQCELKYCERCGGLWLRPAGSDEPYCVRCAPLMAELPVAPVRRRKNLENLRSATVARAAQSSDLQAAGGAA